MTKVDASGFLALDEVRKFDDRKKGDLLVVRRIARGLYTVDGGEKWGDAGLNSKIGHRKPGSALAGPQEEDKAIPLVPGDLKAPNSMEVTYSGTKTAINLNKLFAAHGLKIPVGSKMEIPVAYHDHPKFGPCVMLKMAEAIFTEVDEDDEAEE